MYVIQNTGIAPSNLWHDWLQSQSFKSLPQPIIDDHPQPRSRLLKALFAPKTENNLIPPCAALTSVNTLGAACQWSRRELSQHAPDAGLKRLCERLKADKVKCIPGALNLFRPAHKACEAGRVFLPHAETPRRWCSNMSGNHYKGQEVSCCIKYFIFGFNILFWVRLLYFF